MRVVTQNTTHLLYTALALVSLLGPVRRQPAADKRPDFQVSQATGCEAAAFSLWKQRIADFKSSSLDIPFKSPVKNPSFIKRVLQIPPSDDVLFFHVENTILKQLNDKIFQDKEISAASLITYEKIFFEHLARSPLLRRHWIPAEEGGAYSDFKTIRLAFSTKGVGRRAMEDVLEQLHVAVGREYAANLNARPEIEAFYENAKGIYGDPSNWHLSATATSASVASYLARNQKNLKPGEAAPKKGEPRTPRRQNARSEIEMAAQLREVEEAYLNARERLGESRIMDNQGLTLEALNIFRKASSDPSLVDETAFLKFVKNRLSIRFDEALSDDEVRALQKYFHRAYAFSPSLLLAESEPMRLASFENASHGVLGFDFSDQNSHNVRLLMSGLRSAKTVEEAMKLTTENQQIASSRFEANKHKLAQAISQAHVPGIRIGEQKYLEGMAISGDDGVFLPAQPLGSVAQMRILRQAADSIEPASRLRLTYQSQNFENGARIPDAERFALINEADSIEKSLRDELEFGDLSHRISYQDLRERVLLLHIHPQSDGTRLVDALSARTRGSSKSGDTQWRAKVESAFAKISPRGWSLRSVLDADVLRPVGKEAKSE